MARNKFHFGMTAACGVAAAAALASSGLAQAATLYSTSFEAPAFVAGKSVADSTFDTGAFSAATTSDVTGGVGSATVFSYGTVFGSASTAQLVQFSDSTGIAGTTSAYYFPTVPSAPISPITAGTPVIDSVVQIATNGGGTGGASFGLTAFDGTTAGNEIADFEIDSATGAVSVNGDNPTAAPAATSSTFTAPTTAAFLNYELQLNFTTQTATVYEAPLNSSSFTTAIASAKFLETATSYSTTAIDTVAVSGVAGKGVAEFDNLTISSNAVPEPVSASILFGGLILVGGRRRRTASAL